MRRWLDSSNRCLPPHPGVHLKKIINQIKSSCAPTMASWNTTCRCLSTCPCDHVTRSPNTGPPANQSHIPVLPSSALVVAAAAAARLLLAFPARPICIEQKNKKKERKKENNIDIVAMLALAPNLNSVGCFKSFALPNTKEENLSEASLSRRSRSRSSFPYIFAPRLHQFHGFVAPVCCESNTSISVEFFVCFLFREKKKKIPKKFLAFSEILFFFPSGRAALNDCSSKK